jgi:heat shock protein HtpX
MISALEKLGKGVQEPLPDQLDAFGINGKQDSQGWKILFMSHPPLEQRIEALRQGRVVNSGV